MKKQTAGRDPSVGDFTLYAPWGNLAIFYEDFGYANGLIILGKIESEVEKLSPNATVIDGLAIRHENVNKSQGDVKAWLQKLGMLN